MVRARQLTPKQGCFVEEYLVDLNATQAAIRAGYSERTAEQQAYQLLQKPSVQDAVAERMNARSARTEVTADMVVRELARVGFANMLDYVRLSDDGGVHVDLSGLTRAQAAAIQEVVVDSYTEGRGGGAHEVKRVKFRRGGSGGMRYHHGYLGAA